MIKDNYVIIKKYFKLVKGNRIGIFKLFFSSIVSHGVSLLIPIIIANIIKNITIQNYNYAYICSFLLFLSYFFYNLFLKWNYDVYTQNTKYCCSKIQKDIIMKISTYDDNFQNHVSKGELISTINQDVIDLTKCIDRIAEYIINSISFIWLIIIVFAINSISAVIIFIVCFIYLVLYNRCNKKIVKYTGLSRKNMDTISNTFSQIMTGINEVKVFNLTNKMLEKYDELKEQFDYNYTRRRTPLNVRDNGITYLIYFAKVLIYVLCIYLISKNNLTIDILILLISYYDNSLSICKDIMKNSSAIRLMSVSIDRINSIINYNPVEEIKFGDKRIPNKIENIRFNNVCYKYYGKEENALSNINFEINPDDITALIGHTGSGKSTIGKLLLRLYKNSEGSILINNQDIFEYDKNQYKNLISVVNQRPFVFNMSVMDNFKLVQEDEIIIKKTCKKIGIDEMILNLPYGYDTILNEDATNLSGGQKQLISIARTIMCDSKIIIFDEITSALDPKTTQHIIEILNKIKKDKIVILITHKTDLMKISDKLVLLNNGKIVGIGNHKELIANNNYYKRLLKK